MRLAFYAIIAIAIVLPLKRPGHAASSTTSVQSGFGTSSKEPIQIDADSLDVFDQEQRAVYKGNVIVKQGQTTMKAAKITVYYDRRGTPPLGAKSAAAATPVIGSPDNTNLKKVEAEGGVVVFSQDQVVTGDYGVYDRATDIITMTGNVTLSKGPNVTHGQKLVYHVGTGIATMEAGTGGRVSSSFTPNESSAPTKGKTP